MDAIPIIEIPKELQEYLNRINNTSKILDGLEKTINELKGLGFIIDLKIELGTSLQ